MLRTDRSVAIPTGMIIAGLYVVLLVGVLRESYMRRDAANAEAATSANIVTGTIDDHARRVCRAEPSICAALFARSRDRRICATSIDALREIDGEPALFLTLERLRRALSVAP